MTTRPDVQAKRNTARRLLVRTKAMLNAEAFELEKRAAHLAHTCAELQAEMVSLNIRAAMIRERTRRDD